jgi:uncharacterized NAD(P)/FAD-binding protein YdhS
MNPARNGIVIVGGGASGVLLAAHLLRDGGEDTRVTIIEKRGMVGRGVAYSARQQDHVLNVPATNMSAFADDPDHFWRWLRTRNLSGETDRFVFVPRKYYGAYLGDVLADTAVGGHLTILNERAVDVRTTSAGIEVVLANGASVVGRTAVLAVGHEEQPARGKGIAVRVGSEADTPLDPDAPAMILGSGLSMVDAWLVLAQSDHRGPITVVSRHGLLPQRHDRVEKVELAAADVPFGTDLHYFERWFRDTVDEVVARGGDWRSVVDALRPFNQRIWQNWSDTSRRRFLDHLRPFWNIHRHRLPPDLHARLEAAIASGQVTLRAGSITDLTRTSDGVLATIRAKGGGARETLKVARVYDCGGVTVDVRQSSNPVITSLIERGDARPDRLNIGLDVTTECEVIDASGTPADRLYAIGPLTRGTFFEIEAIPDIRVQAAALAAELVRPTRTQGVAPLLPQETPLRR